MTRRPVRANEWARVGYSRPRNDYTLVRAVIVGLVASAPVWALIWWIVK